MTLGTRWLFVEGGGDHNHALQTECRRAFRTLLERAGFKGRMPRIVACGPRTEAYRQFCTAFQDLGEGDLAVLLVDSESPVTSQSPWRHVKDRSADGWNQPSGARDDHLHLMVQCMEAWFLADRNAMRGFFGNGYQESRLPPANTSIENVQRTTLFQHLKAATKDAEPKGEYEKGRHAFKLLARLDPALVREASDWADRFFSTLDRLLPQSP